MTRRALALAAVLITACASVGLRGGLPESQVTAFPPPVQDAYAVFAVRCSRCHSLARPLTAQIDSEAHWRAYVARMRRQPGSGISEADGEEILVFLRYSLERRRDTATSTTTGGGR